MKRRGIALGAALAVLCLLGAGPGFSGPAKAESSATASQHTASPTLHQVQIKSGDSLETVLISAGATPVEAGLVGKALRKIFNPRDLKPGQNLAIRFQSAAKGAPVLAAASLELAKGRFVEVGRTKSGGYAAKRTKQALAGPNATPTERKTTAALASQSAPAKALKQNASKSASATPGARTLRVKAGQTLVSLMRAARIDGDDANRAVKALGGRIDTRSLRIGQEVVIVPGPRTGKRYALAVLAVTLNDGTVAEVRRQSDGSFAAPESGDAPTATAAAKPRKAEPATHVAAAVIAPVAKPAVPARPNAEAATESPVRAKAVAADEEIVTLEKGGTLHSQLKTRGYRATDVAAVAKATALSVDPTALHWGQEIRLSFHRTRDGAKHLDGLAIQRKDQPPLVIARRADGEFGPASPVMASLTSEPTEAALASNGTVDDEATDEEYVDSPAIYIEEQAAPRDAAYRIVVQPGDSLMNLLLREGIDATEIDEAVRSLRKIYNPRRLREGQIIALLTDVDSSGGLHLGALSIGLSERRHVEVRRGPETDFKASFQRTPSFADRLPPEGVETLYAGYPAIAQGDLAHAALNGRGRIGDSEDGDEPEGWSVLSWLGGVGDLLGRTGSAEAAVIDLAPEPKPNRALDLEERSGAVAEDRSFRKIEIAKNDTLVSALSRGGVAATEAEAVVAAFKKIHSPRRLQVGQTIALAFDAIDVPAGSDKTGGARQDDTAYALRRISLSIGPDRDIVVERGRNDRFSAREVERPLLRSVYKATGRISSSFYESALAAGLSMDVLTQLVQLCSYDVDFQRGVQRGDRFEVLFERTENDRGDVVEQGTVLFAALTVSGEELAFFRFEPPDGPADYFDRSGNSVRKALLRTPIDGARISSGFGMRKHPILGYSKKHKGVDFSAPPGTPIYAAGDGVIEKIGWFSSYGKYVRIKHNEAFKTAYAHLKGYARGMKIGTKVRQGQVIGYVGSSGRSTGPHLHYEVMKREVQVNPNDTKLPVGKQLAGKQLARFKTEIDSYRVMFAQAGTLGARLARNAMRGN